MKSHFEKQKLCSGRRAVLGYNYNFVTLVSIFYQWLANNYKCEITSLYIIEMHKNKLFFCIKIKTLLIKLILWSIIGNVERAVAQSRGSTIWCKI